MYVVLHFIDSWSLPPWNRFKPSSKIFLSTVPKRYFFCRSFVLFMSCVWHPFASVHCWLVVTCWERSYLLALLCDVQLCVFFTFPCGILCQVWYLIASVLETGLSLPVKYFYWQFQGGTSFVDHLCYLCLLFVMLLRLFIGALWSPAGEEMTSWLSFVMFNWAETWDFQQCGMCDRTSFQAPVLKRRRHGLRWVYTCQNATLLEISCHDSIVFCHFPMRYPGSGVVLDCIDSWYLPPFLLCIYV